jgi:hypothetical protein
MVLDKVATTPGLTLAELRERLAAEHGLSARDRGDLELLPARGRQLKNAAAIRASQARCRPQASELAALSGLHRG